MGGKILKGKREMAEFDIKKEMNRKRKEWRWAQKLSRCQQKKNTGMDENIPVLTKDRAKTILYPYYITYMKALLSILKSTASLLSNNFLRLVFDFLF